MLRTYDRKLVFRDGSEFYGCGFGAALTEPVIMELVFNTSMAGYQEIFSDPSYTRQMIVMSYPLIGNYGMAEEDYESASLTPGAVVVREYNPRPSNFRSSTSLGDVMIRDGIPGIEGVDTRALVRRIRNEGSQMAAMVPADWPAEELLLRLSSAAPRSDCVRSILTGRPKELHSSGSRFHVAVIDCGIKENILREFTARGAKLKLFPWNVSAAELRFFQPDGIFVSNGPGDPADVPETEAALREVIGMVPLFGICLGHQLLARAMGASTYKLHFGHRGGNHPVLNLVTGKVEITSQNHSFAVDEASLPGTGLTVTHRNLLDQTIEGLSCPEKHLFSVQYHPESAPGPQDSAYLFDQFFAMMEEAIPCRSAQIFTSSWSSAPAPLSSGRQPSLTMPEPRPALP